MQYLRLFNSFIDATNAFASNTSAFDFYIIIIIFSFFFVCALDMHMYMHICICIYFTLSSLLLAITALSDWSAVAAKYACYI